MLQTEKVIFDGDTKLGHYQIIDMVYSGRPARVLFSGHRAAAQAATPKDDNPAMLFDYNQRFMELMQSLKPRKILLIGGGAFTLPVKILETFAQATVDVIEVDRELINLSKQFFGLKPNERLKVIAGDGRKYLQTTKKDYDLILVDAFTHNVIPRALYTKEFAELIKSHLEKNGITAINIISAYHGPNDSVIKQQYATYKSVFKHVDVFPADRVLSYWISQNFLLVSTSRLRKPKYNLRFEGLKPPLTNLDDIQYDKNT